MCLSSASTDSEHWKWASMQMALDYKREGRQLIRGFIASFVLFCIALKTLLSLAILVCSEYGENCAASQKKSPEVEGNRAVDGWSQLLVGPFRLPSRKQLNIISVTVHPMLIGQHVKIARLNNVKKAT